MWFKVNFGYPKLPTAAILSKISKQIKVAYRSQMARNEIKSEFRISKMGAGGHFVNNLKKSFALIWNGQKCDRKWFSDIQNGRRQPFCKKIHNIKIVVLNWNGNKCDTKWFLDIQNGYRRPFKKKTFTKKIARVIWIMFELIAGRLQLDINSLLVNVYIYIYIQTGMLGRGNIHCVPPLGRMHTILVYDEIYQCMIVIEFVSGYYVAQYHYSYNYKRIHLSMCWHKQALFMTVQLKRKLKFGNEMIRNIQHASF